jgi:MFS family permease
VGVGGHLASQESPTTTKPRFFYGYIMVLVSAIVLMLTFGVNYSFGIFFTPLRAEFGWTKAVTSAGYSISYFVSGFLGIFAGRFTDRFSAKAVSIVGGCFLGLGCILMSRINTAWQFCLIYGLVVAAGVGGPWPSLTSTVSKWFLSRRGLMTGIVASGPGISMIVVPPLISRMIPVHGWRSSYIILGTFSLVFIVIAALFMRRDPHQMGQSLYGDNKGRQEQKVPAAPMLSYREMVHSRRFWMVCVIYYCFGFSLHTIAVHLVPHAIEIGILPGTAAGLMFFVGGSSIPSKLAVGAISDKIGVKLSLAYNFILLTGALLWLQGAGGIWTLRGFALVFGFAYGGLMTLQPILSAELFGLSSLGLVVGSISFIYTMGSAMGPLISGYLFDVTGSYSLAFFLCAILEALALVLVLTTLRYPSTLERSSAAKEQ